jgi:hypothetical protein
VPEYIKNDVLNLNKKYKFIKMWCDSENFN